MEASKQLPSRSRVLCAVASGLVWFSATGITQTFTILKSFGNLTNIAGINPRSQLVPGLDGTLYGNEALEKFALQDARKAELVKLGFFVGMTFEEAAEVLGIAVPTAKQWWAFARAWLRVELAGPSTRGPLGEG